MARTRSSNQKARIVVAILRRRFMTQGDLAEMHILCGHNRVTEINEALAKTIPPDEFLPMFHKVENIGSQSGGFVPFTFDRPDDRRNPDDTPRREEINYAVYSIPREGIDVVRVAARKLGWLNDW